MGELYKNYIGGKWVEAKSGKTFENRNPANRSDLIGLFPASGREDVDEAVSAAKMAFLKWRLVPAPKRGETARRWSCSSCGHGRRSRPSRSRTRTARTCSRS